MSKISFHHRISSNGVTGAIYVKHTHQGSPFPISTTVVLEKGQFDPVTRKVAAHVDGAPELEATILKVYTYMQMAVRNLQSAGVEPNKYAMRQEYEAVKKKIEDQLQRNEDRTARLTDLVERSRPRRLDQLRVQLLEQEAALAETKKELLELEIKMKIYVPPAKPLLADYCEQYAKAKDATCAENTTRLFKSLSRKVNEYDKDWQIDQVTPRSLKRFEQWMIAAGRRNLTITDALTKIKTVVYYYAEELEISLNAIQVLRAHTPEVKKKRNPNVIYLTQPELQELIDLPLSDEEEQRVRDRFVLMCLLGIRYSDSTIAADDIKDGHLVLTTEKTDTDLEIPIGELADSILKRYDYTIPTYHEQYFNRIIKLICSRLTTLQHKIKLKDYRGKNKPERSKVKKYTKISGHVARRTFINLALVRGVNPVAIASIVGHAGTDLIMKVYGSKKAGIERMMDLLSQEKG